MDQPRLSERARRSLEERLQQLEDERIPALERDLLETGDASAEVALSVAKEELDRLRQTLSSATALEDEPHDPTVAELGDTVAIRREASAEEDRFTLVGALEARVDDTWISVESPLGAALLNRRSGEVVEVETPDGVARYTIVGITRG